MLAAFLVPFAVSLAVHSLISDRHAQALERARLARRAEIASRLGLEYARLRVSQGFTQKAFLATGRLAKSTREHLTLSEHDGKTQGTLRFADGEEAGFVIDFQPLIKAERDRANLIQVQSIEVHAIARHGLSSYALSRELSPFLD